MRSWILLSILVKVVCVASFIAAAWGLIQTVKSALKEDRVREHHGLILLIPSTIVFAVTLVGAPFVDAAIRIFF